MSGVVAAGAVEEEEFGVDYGEEEVEEGMKPAKAEGNFGR